MSLFYWYLFKNMSKHSVKTLCQQLLDPLVEGTEGMCQPLPLTYDKSIVDFIPVRASERDESAKKFPRVSRREPSTAYSQLQKAKQSCQPHAAPSLNNADDDGIIDEFSKFLEIRHRVLLFLVFLFSLCEG